MLEYKCDRCGRVVENSRNRSDLEIEISTTKEINLWFYHRKLGTSTKELTVDLCDKCSDEFMEWLHGDN